MASDPKSLEAILRALGATPSSSNVELGTPFLSQLPLASSQPSVRLRNISADNLLSADPYPLGNRNSLADLIARPQTAPSLTTKRKAFFSFHYDDIMRVNVVRNAWAITHPSSGLMRSFYDSSLWEKRKLESDDSLKRLIRNGVNYTSAVCVLVGADTWQRRWVRYEIARAVIDGRGVLSVHLNSIRHHQSKSPHPQGLNPLSFLAVGRVEDSTSSTRYYLYEKLPFPDEFGSYQWQWTRYQDFTDPIARPRWLRDPHPGHVMPLSVDAETFDYIANDGKRNIGSWIDRAAIRAGR